MFHYKTDKLGQKNVGWTFNLKDCGSHVDQLYVKYVR